MQAFFLAAQGLQGLQAFFFAAQGLQGLQAFFFLAEQGLQAATTTPSREDAWATGTAAIAAADKTERVSAVTLRELFNIFLSC
ncbi:MAG: hypothetical protein JKX94_12800 [Sneathiella sp.]|nr:hypothetical protein [Sneathiella sp.]